MLNRRSFLQWLDVGLLATPRSLLRGVAASESPDVATDRELNREVALKQMQARVADYPEARARFMREAACYSNVLA